jgi:hypothetical protein
MALPDTILSVLSASAPNTLPTDTGQCFAVGVTQRGSSVGPQLCRSINDVATLTGARLTTSAMYDWCDHYFQEGGTNLWISRVYGSGAVAATVNLMDSGAAVALVVTAGAGPSVSGQPDPGTWANGATGGLKIAVITSGLGYALQVSLNNVIVETSPTLITAGDGIAWGNTSQYVDIGAGVSGFAPNTIAATNLAGGTDGSAVVDADFQAAFDRIPGLLGPGQVAVPGQTGATRQIMALQHCQQRNRFAQLDGLDTASASTLVSQAAALYGALNSARRWGQLFAPWDIINGVTPNSTRTVPSSARAAAGCAKIDALGNPNQAVAGKHAYAVNTLDLSQPAWSDTDRLALNNAGVTISRRRYGNVIAIWGLRNLADQNSDTQWSEAPNVRCIMAYAAQAKAIGDQHEFDQVDGFGHALSAFQSDLIGAAMPFFQSGAFYGATPAEAFRVDVGPAVNTLANIQAGIMTANVSVRVSSGVEQTRVNIIKFPITVSL